MAQPRTTFPPFVTANTYGDAWQHVFQRAEKRHGKTTAADGTLSPRLTNGELSDLVRAWKEAVTGARFPLWSQWAALAYGWNPRRPTALIATPKQRDALLDADTTKDFWLATFQVANNVDDGRSTARLDIDDNTFADPVWLATVRADLLADGAKVAWKLPLPACKDPKTGKTTPTYLGCAEGWVLVEVSPGAFMCKEVATGKLGKPVRVCKGEQVTVSDPITVAIQKLAGPLLILGAAWWFLRRDNTRSATRRKRLSYGS